MGRRRNASRYSGSASQLAYPGDILNTPISPLSTLKDLAKALGQFQAKHVSAARDSKGNYGAYTSLAAALAAVQGATEFGLAHTQTMKAVCEPEFGHILVTTLLHISGDQLTSEILLPSKMEGRGNYMQALGSALTYARRYAILAIYGLASEDDDCQSQTPPSTRKELLKPIAAIQVVATKVIAASKDSLDPERKERLVSELKNSPTKEAILQSFKTAFSIQAERMGPSQIQLPAHADFLEAQLAQTY